MTIQSDHIVSTWEDAAEYWVNFLWSDVSYNSYSLDDLRDHVDVMVDRYFYCDADKLFIASDWIKMAKIALSDVPEVSSERMISILCSKQNDYGPYNILKFLHKGLIMRVHDKIARLENLLGNSLGAYNEPIEDTYIDIIGYSVIGLLLVSNQFQLPLTDSWSKPVG